MGLSAAVGFTTGRAEQVTLTAIAWRGGARTQGREESLPTGVHHTWGLTKHASSWGEVVGLARGSSASFAFFPDCSISLKAQELSLFVFLGCILGSARTVQVDSDTPSLISLVGCPQI
jgi:hypothetical protein